VTAQSGELPGAVRIEVQDENGDVIDGLRRYQSWPPAAATIFTDAIPKAPFSVQIAGLNAKAPSGGDIFTGDSQ
jgi:hypothetical protein